MRYSLLRGATGATIGLEEIFAGSSEFCLLKYCLVCSGSILHKTMTDGQESDDILDDLPPSAKLVLKVIEHEGEMDKKEISEKARLPDSTTQYALKKLVENGVVGVKVGDGDGRRLVYSEQADV